MHVLNLEAMKSISGAGKGDGGKVTQTTNVNVTTNTSKGSKGS